MYLQHISVFGFRGADTRFDVPLDQRTILFGPNGSGKTTLLQAVTWAIYGRYPLLSGTIFTDEDALVNDFVEEAKADVELT
jgi:DNA repair exonuclease SbcCD ATPase subunit